MKSPEKGDPRVPVQPVVRYAPASEIKIYMVQESELESLANGSSDSLYLNLALVLLPTFLSLVVSLLTTEIKSLYTFAAFTSIAAVCLILGVTFLLLWFRNRKSNRRLIEEIKARMPPPPGIQEPNP